MRLGASSFSSVRFVRQPAIQSWKLSEIVPTTQSGRDHARAMSNWYTAKNIILLSCWKRSTSIVNKSCSRISSMLTSSCSQILNSDWTQMKTARINYVGSHDVSIYPPFFCISCAFQNCFPWCRWSTQRSDQSVPTSRLSWQDLGFRARAWEDAGRTGANIIFASNMS